MSDWDAQQEKSLRRWINSQIVSDIGNLETDLQDGLILVELVNKLVENSSNDKHKSYSLSTLYTLPKTHIQKVENVAESIEFIKIILQINICNISAENIVEGNLKLILGLIWSLLVYSTTSKISKALSNECNSFYKIKVILKDWINLIIRKKGGVLLEISNFDRDWSLEINRPDLILACILEHYLGSTTLEFVDYLEMEQNGKKLQNLKKIFTTAEVLGIPQMVDVEDFLVLVPDEKCVIIYLLEWLKIFELEEVEDDGERITLEKEITKQPFVNEAVRQLEHNKGVDKGHIQEDIHILKGEIHEVAQQEADEGSGVDVGATQLIDRGLVEEEIHEEAQEDEDGSGVVFEAVQLIDKEHQRQKVEETEEEEEEEEVVIEKLQNISMDEIQNVAGHKEEYIKDEEDDLDIDLDLEDAVIEETISVKICPISPSKASIDSPAEPELSVSEQGLIKTATEARDTSLRSIDMEGSNMADISSSTLELPSENVDSNSLSQTFHEHGENLKELLESFKPSTIDTISSSLKKCFDIVDDLKSEDLELFNQPISLLKQLQDALIKFDCNRAIIKTDLDSIDVITSPSSLWIGKFTNLILLHEQFSMLASIAICNLASEFLYVEETIQDKIQHLSLTELLLSYKKNFEHLCSTLETLEDYFQNLEVSKFISDLKEILELIGKSEGQIIKSNRQASLTSPQHHSFKQEMSKSYSDFSIYNSDNSAQSSLFES